MPPQKAERRGRPWFVNVVGIVILVLVIRTVAGSLGEPVLNMASRPARPTSVPPTATATLRPGLGVGTSAERTAQPQSGSTIAPTPHSITGVAEILGYSWGFAAPFDQTVTLDEVETDLVSSHIDTEGLSITIKAPGGLDTYTYETLATEGRDARFRIDVASTSGWGEITMILRASSGEPEWTFGVDPAAQKWSLYRTSAATKELFYWVEPRPYTSLMPGAIKIVEVQVIDGNPALWLNGSNVVAPFGIAMPEMPESLFFGFGAGINPYSLTGYSQSFAVNFERAELRKL
jgi:hypothetical protein